MRQRDVQLLFGGIKRNAMPASCARVHPRGISISGKINARFIILRLIK